MFKYAEQYIKALLQGIYDGTITEQDLPESLYHAIADYLKNGVYEGFGDTLATAPEGDMELLEDLRNNIYMFSAAKTFQQVKEMTEALKTEDGTFKPFNEFKKDASQIFDTYNKDYLKTEYNTAIGQAQNASQWQRIQKEKSVLPYLEYSTVGDACDICAPFDHLTAPVDDPIWDQIMPLNHFNCHCMVEQTSEADANVTPDDEKDEKFKSVTGKMSDVFKMNAGKDGYVFSPDHPYFSVPKADIPLAQKNFNLKIPPKDD